MKKITFAYWGNYTIAFRTLLERLGFEVIPPEKTNPKVIEEGAKLSPELFCFPLKVNIGNYLPALRKGADNILMWENIGGSCRMRYYWIVQEKILREAGFNIRVLNFNSQNLFSRIKEIKKENQISLWQILQAVRFFFREINFIETIEEKAQYFRPREIEKGQTEKVFNQSLTKLEQNSLLTFKELSGLAKEAWQDFSKIAIDKNRKILKVGIIGEIYTVVDGEVNLGLDKKLGEMGIEVQRKLNLSQHLKGGFPPWNEWLLQRKVNPYLKTTVGGHGRQAIEEMIDYTKEGFDGVIQLLPFGCFVKDTSITVESFLQKPIQEIKMGEKVLTHKGRFKKVIQTFCRNYEGKILKIDCGGKLKLEITPEHPILLAKSSIRGGRKKEIQNLKFAPVAEAKRGDFIAIPIPKEVNNKDYLEWQKEYKRRPKWEDIKRFPYSSELMRMLGYWLAEGHIHYDSGTNKQYKRGIVFNFGSQEKDYIEDVIDMVKRNFRAKISQYYRPDRPNAMELYIGNRNLGDIVSYLCAEHCDGKKIHQDLITLEPPLQKEILKGFFRGDGCLTDKYGETTYRGVTTSWNLASQLFWLLIRNRIKTSLMEQRIRNRKLSYMIKIANAEGIRRLGDELIKVTDRKNYVRFRELKNYFLVPIRKIETLAFKGKVYNLEVEEDHSYVANFLACHNCMPEITVRPILQKISQERNIPFLSISLDEQTGEAGLQTRLEAFVDLIKSRHKTKNNHHQI